jgi:glycolate oxidase
VRAEIRDLQRVIGTARPLFVDRALGPDACERLWQIRREFSYALRDTGLTKLNQDVVVPRGRLEDLFQFTARLQKKHGFAVAAFGHAGDGNIHVNIMVDREQPGADRCSKAALDDLFRQILAWDGSITGEHGIGLAKLPWWPQAADENVRALHRRVKHALDPRMILNPGKFV